MNAKIYTYITEINDTIELKISKILKFLVVLSAPILKDVAVTQIAKDRLLLIPLIQLIALEHVLHSRNVVIAIAVYVHVLRLSGGKALGKLDDVLKLGWQQRNLSWLGNVRKLPECCGSAVTDKMCHFRR